MDLRSLISDLQKIRSVNNSFQTKLGEITILINNNPQVIQNSPKDLVLLFIKILQSFLCHNYYMDYVNVKSSAKGNINMTNINMAQEIKELKEIGNNKENTSNNIHNSSIYDNSMNLILVISAQISKLHINYAKCMIDYFIEHINTHSDCFNYIISFYRLYISCNQIKQAGKENGIYNNLFELYKKLYRISHKFESSDFSQIMTDLNSLEKIRDCETKCDQKSFLANLMNVHKETSEERERNTETFGSSTMNYYNSVNRTVLNSQERGSNRFSILNTIKFPNVNTVGSNKMMTFSKTDRKSNNKHLSNDFGSGLSMTSSILNIKLDKDRDNEINKTSKDREKIKIPELKFPINNHHYSLTRSSRRNEFSKSGGGSTNHTGIIKERGGATSNNNLDNTSKKEILIDNSSSNNRNLEIEENIVSPQQKLRALAFQLGESCLAVDLAALINQKRDLELEKIAKGRSSKKETPAPSTEKRRSNHNRESDYIEKLKYIDKLEESENEDTIKNLKENSNNTSFTNNQNQLKNLLNKKPLLKYQIKDEIFNNNSNSISQNNFLDFTKDFKKKFVFSFDNNIGSQVDKTYRNYIKIREILTNFILSCLKEFSVDEFHFLKINLNLIYSYFLLPSFDLIRRKLERKKCEYLEHMHEFNKDPRGVASEGSFFITEKKEILRTKMQTDKSQTINEEMMKNLKPNFASKEKASFDSFLSINFEDDRSSSLALKSELDVLNEILAMNSSSLEHLLKGQNFHKLIFYSIENSEPENIEFWSNGILFNYFSKVSLEAVRKHSDLFLERIKNRISFLLKNYSMRNINRNNINLFKTLKQQLDILKDYISCSKSKIIPIHLMFEFSEILIIMKKNFIDIFTKLGPFQICSNEIKLIDKSDYLDIKIPDEVLELFMSYLEVLAKIIVNTQIFTCEKLLNDLFIICPSFLEILKFIILYVFTKDISDSLNKDSKISTSNRKFSINSNYKSGNKYTLINFIKEADGTINDISLTNNISKIYDNYKDYLQLALVLINYLHNSTVFYHKIVIKENLDKIKDEEKESNKFWIGSIREYLRFLNIFINSKFGIFYEYITNYGSYIKINNFRDKEISTLGSEKQNSVINFALTRALLTLQHSVFEFNHRFSFIANESTSLDLIRIHYISFIKLYNKNLDFKAKLGDVGKLLENCDHNQKKRKVRALIRDIYNDQNHLQVIINLCKLHLMCLFSLAKNRNMDVTNKFFQLRIVDFMVKELDLEHEGAEKLFKMKNYLNNRKNSIVKSKDSSNNYDKIINSNEINLNTVNTKETGDKFVNGKNLKPFSLNLNMPNKNKLKEEIISNKYKSKQEAVWEEGEDDTSKFSIKKKQINFSNENEVEGVEDKLSINNILSNNESSKNIIIEDLELEKNPTTDKEKKIDESGINKSDNEEDEESDPDEYNEDDDDSDYSDVMLVELKPKINPYEYKIPKLSLIPTTLSESSLGGAIPQKPVLKMPIITLKKKEIPSSWDEQPKNDESEYATPHKILSLKQNLKNTTPISNNTLNLTSNLSICQLKPESVQLSFNKDESSNILPNNISNNISNNMSNNVNNLNEKKKLSIFDLQSIPNSKSLHNKLNTNAGESNNIINKLNLKTRENVKEKEDAAKDVVNYAGNKGIPFQKIEVPKLNIKSVSNNSKDKNEKHINDEINFINIEHPLRTKEELEKLEKSLKDQNVNKIQLAFENMLKNKYNLFYRKAAIEELKEEDLLNFNLFYLKERNNRLLYHDTELQVLILSVVMCLIITPARGTLDELYCSYYPCYESNKMNILYILHHHLNHQDNQEILPLLYKYASEINPIGAGQRLMKLLCVSLFDISIYRDWDKIASGAYGQVFQCSTNLLEPSLVAIKKIGVAESIYDFCHLFDIFTEVTALETFRMEGCVTHLFDYGVDREYYYIVMKRYQMSLKDWRTKQTANLNEMLPIYLNIYKDVLKAVHSIHNYKTTHYDIKCDNVVIDLPVKDWADSEKDINEGKFDHYNEGNEGESLISVKIADFGECKMFLSEKDEYCVRSRGTNVIKSPEMLRNYGFGVKTDDENYDRRKRMGTTRSSDIWSLGCLLYELLTGKFLFEEIETDYFGFMYKTNTSSVSELLTDEKLKELNNNPYLIDFLKFILVKDQNYRPNIETIMKRFEHVHALLVSFGVSPISNNLHSNISKRFSVTNVEGSIQTLNDILNSQVEQENVIVTPNDIKLKWIPSLIKITEEIYIADFNYTESNYDKLIKLGVTHIISWTKTKNKETDKIFFLNILENDIQKDLNSHIFKVMDLLRHCMVYRGIVLFVDDFEYTNMPFKPNFLIRSILILSFAYMLNLSAYDAWTYINSKLLFFWLPPSSMTMLSQWVKNQSVVYNFAFSHPAMKCLCGACVIIIKRGFSNVSNNNNVKNCACSTKHKNIEYSDCPSNGCYDYIQQIKKCYGLNYEYMQWGLYTPDDFILGPGDISFLENVNLKQIIPCSRGLEDNLIQHSVNEKKSIKLTSKKTVWNLFKCRICQVWMYGENNERYQLLINNNYNFNKKAEQKKLLIKTNHLKNLKLAKLL